MGLPRSTAERSATSERVERRLSAIQRRVRRADGDGSPTGGDYAPTLSRNVRLRLRRGAVRRHGYVICEEKYGVVTTFTNHYLDDQLAEVIRDGTSWLYTWVDDHVATIQSGENETTYVWEDDTLMSQQRRVDGELVSGWSATLDERGRVAVGTSLDGEVYTYDYETDAEWPVTILDSAGNPVWHYSASCPSD